MKISLKISNKSGYGCSRLGWSRHCSLFFLRQEILLHKMSIGNIVMEITLRWNNIPSMGLARVTVYVVTSCYKKGLR